MLMVVERATSTYIFLQSSPYIATGCTQTTRTHHRLVHVRPKEVEMSCAYALCIRTGSVCELASVSAACRMLDWARQQAIERATEEARQQSVGSETGRRRTAETVGKDEKLVTEPSRGRNSPELEWLPSKWDEAERSCGSSRCRARAFS